MADISAPQRFDFPVSEELMLRGTRDPNAAAAALLRKIQGNSQQMEYNDQLDKAQRLQDALERERIRRDMMKDQMSGAVNLVKEGYDLSDLVGSMFNLSGDQTRSGNKRNTAKSEADIADKRASAAEKSASAKEKGQPKIKVGADPLGKPTVSVEGPADQITPEVVSRSQSLLGDTFKLAPKTQAAADIGKPKMSPQQMKSTIESKGAKVNSITVDQNGHYAITLTGRDGKQYNTIYDPINDKRIK